LKNYVALKNALQKNKPTAYQLKRLAQQEAYRQTSKGILGLRKGAKEEYVALKNRLYKQYLQEFDVQELPGETPQISENTEENIDWQDVNW